MDPVSRDGTESSGVLGLDRTRSRWEKGNDTLSSSPEGERLGRQDDVLLKVRDTLTPFGQTETLSRRVDSIEPLGSKLNRSQTDRFFSMPRPESTEEPNLFPITTG